MRSRSPAERGPPSSPAPVTESDEPERDTGDRLARLGVDHRAALYTWCFRLALFACLLVSLFPIYWLLVMALTPHLLVWGQIGVVPPAVSAEGFVLALTRHNWVLAFANSLFVSVVTTLLVLLVGIPAGYAFGRLRFPGRRPLFALVLLLAVFPPQAVAKPLYHLFVTQLTVVGIDLPVVYRTPAAIILPISTFALPLSIGLLTVFFAGIPDDLEQAARIAGATRHEAIRYVVLPLARPGVVSVATLVFVEAYTEQFFSRFMSIGDGAVETSVQLVIYNIYNPKWALAYPNALAAAGLLGLVPSFFVLLVMVGRLDTWLSAWGDATA